jgi:hypothetical protein
MFAKSPMVDGAEPPNFELVEEGPDAVPAMKTIDFDVTVSMGEGLPNNKIAVHNVLMNLFQLGVLDQQAFAEKTEQFLGIDLDTAGIAKRQEMAAMQQQAAQGMVNPASETSVGVPMGTQTSATSNSGMAGTIPGGGALPMRTAGAV